MKKWMKKVKSWMKTKAAKASMAVSVACVALAGSAFAAEGDTPAVSVDTTSIMSAFSSGFNQVITTAIQLISIMLPLVLSFFAVKFIAVKGMAWFKSMAK